MAELFCSINKLFNQSSRLMILNFIMSVIFLNTVYAQTGSINGKITDGSTNETLIGANVLVVGTTTGASTDIDGFYSIKTVAPGTYQLKVSYISYQTTIIDNVVVKEGQDTKLNVPLNPSSTELDEVVITAEALKNSEASILKIQKSSDGIVDGVSAELISKNNSSDGTDVMKRMTGVTIADGKYAYIRGVGDRYNNTLLNGASLPSTDPEKKSFSYDIFPASLIENIITAKTFTPDKPADFSGGLVQISTIEFPSHFIFNFSTDAAYNTNTTSKDFATYPGSETDYLGYDNGTRSLPGIINSTRVVRSSYSPDQMNTITSSFKNNWNTHSQKAPMNGSFKLTIGDKYDLSDNTFGYIASLTYSNSGQTKNIQKNFHDFSGDRYNYSGKIYNRSVVWGGLLNLSYKFGEVNKVSFKNVYNQNADDETSLYSGEHRYSESYRDISTLRYISRSLLSNQLIGAHEIGLFKGLNFNWNISYAQSERNEPDARRTVYSRALEDTDEPLRFQLDQSLATRYYGELTDHNYGFNTDITLKLFESPELPKFKFGFSYDKKDRNFDARSFGFRNGPGGNFSKEDSVLKLDVEQIFQPENINSTFIQVVEITKASDSYDSKQTVNAGYLMMDANILSDFRLVAGARIENSNQQLNSVLLDGAGLIVDNDYNDILPAINLTYLFNDIINLRVAYSKTLARPEFRELAPFSYFDFVASELIQGNPELKRSLIDNYDFRFEIYPGAGELLAVSFFYKKFKNPIEQTLIASANEPIRSYANAISAKNYGIELELRKSLFFITPLLKDFSIVGNVSLIQSEVELAHNGFQVSNRPLQGQADYIFNAGLYYDNYELGLSSSLVYNKVGERIDKVGSVDLGDIIEKPVDLIDVSVSQKLLDVFTVKLTVKDILNQDRVLIQQAPGGDRRAEVIQTGRNISLGINYQLQ